MGVNAALVDRMRWIRNQTVGARVDGETKTEVVEGPWIKCRLSQPTYTQRKGDEAYEYVRDVSAIANPRSSSGEPFDIVAGDKVEVESAAFGNEVYELMAPPEPVRALRRIVLWNMGLRKHTHTANRAT